MDQHVFWTPLCVMSTALGLIHCSASSGSEPTDSLASTKAALTIQTANDQNVSGDVTVAGQSLLQFESVTQNSSLGQYASVVRAGGNSVEWTVDSSTGDFVVDGHDLQLTAALVGDFQQAAIALHAAFTGDDAQAAALTSPQKVLLAQLDWLADGQAGYVVSRHADSLLPPGPTTGGGPSPLSYVNDGAWCINSWKGQTHTAYVLDDLARFQRINLVVGGTGTRPNHKGNWQCLGQCGEGCQPWYKNGYFMDCFEHDACTYTRRSDICYYAFVNAADDYLKSYFSPLCN